MLEEKENNNEELNEETPLNNEEINQVQEEQANEPVQEKKPNKFFAAIGKFFYTIWTWLRRMFMGASKDLDRELSKAEKKDGAARNGSAVEQLESPGRIAAKKFFRKKIAVGALVVLTFMFGFVFIGPMVSGIDYSYTDPTQRNLAPNLSLLNVPAELNGDINKISGVSSFTVGLSNSHKLYTWGVTYDNGSRIDVSNYPESIHDDNVAFAAAGVDHIATITTDGQYVAWGNNTQGQCGLIEDPTTVIKYFPMNDMFWNPVDVTKVTEIYAGNKFTAIIYDGKLYTWGNANVLINIESINYDRRGSDAVKAAFSNYYGIVLTSAGKIKGVNNDSPFDVVISVPGANKLETLDSLDEYLFDKTIVDIAANSNVFYFVTSDGVLGAFGVEKYGERDLPLISAEQKFMTVVASGQHGVAVTDDHKAYGFGLNSSGQVAFNGIYAERVFVGNKQTYILNADNKVISSFGLKGYLMGTDKLGRDVFSRIMHGGKMTMTIGAVAVIISTIIAVIIGCLSGYFGGWVDMLLMRLTEIVGAIPFLPFAMLLSHVLTYTTVDETTRIFIIMVILGCLSWTGLAHMIRGQVLAEREKDFVLAAKAMGVKEGRIAFKHILPNVLSIIFVSVTLDFAGCMLTESSLSYLGFGVKEPSATWGNMLNAAKNDTVIKNYWWQWVFPSVFLAIATICINIIGDALRDALDPKGTGER